MSLEKDSVVGNSAAFILIPRVRHRQAGWKLTGPNRQCAEEPAGVWMVQGTGAWGD